MGEYGLSLYTDAGTPIMPVTGWTELTYSRVVNSTGNLKIIVAETVGGESEWFSSFLRSALKRDNILAVYRAPTLVGKHVLKRMECWYFLRAWENISETGAPDRVDCYGMGPAYLLAGRIVDYYSGAPQSHRTEKPTQMMRHLVLDNLGTDATDPLRNWMDTEGLRVEAEKILGTTMDLNAAKMSVPDALKKISQTSETNGLPLFYDIEGFPPGTLNYVAEFRTYPNQRGTDRTTGQNQITFSREAGTLKSARLLTDYSVEVTAVTAGGQGSGLGRTYVRVTDDDRIGQSIWGRREAYLEAGTVGSAAELTDKANARLRDGRPKLRFVADLVDTPNCAYGVDWDFGDKVSARFMGQTFTGQIKAVTVSAKRDPATGAIEDSVQARLEVDA